MQPSKFFTSSVQRPAILLVVGLLIMSLSACGKKGPVKPKLKSLPAAPGDVSLHQQGNNFLLSWTIPTQNQDGSKAEDLESFVIKRLSYAAEESCPTCRDPEERLVELEIDYPAPAVRLGNRLYWRDLEVIAGSGYRYAIAPLTLGNVGGEAAFIHQAWQTPPPTPTGLTAEAGNLSVNLTWDPVGDLPEGQKLVGYNIYRRFTGSLFAPVPINPEPLEQSELNDRGLENGRSYEYRISSLVKTDSARLESELSSGATAQPAAGR
jgi:hypothetical protein